MKKLTIFRNAEADVSTDRLMRACAYRVLAQSKELAKTLGPAFQILTSHVPRATRTAQVIKLANPKAQVLETAFLSQYYAGAPKRFISTFAHGLPYYVEHVIAVSHMMNIGDLTRGGYLKRGNCLTIEAEKWEDMFNPQIRQYTINDFRLDEKSPEEIVAECNLSSQEQELLNTLPFLTD